MRCYTLKSEKYANEGACNSLYTRAGVSLKKAQISRAIVRARQFETTERTSAKKCVKLIVWNLRVEPIKAIAWHRENTVDHFARLRHNARQMNETTLKYSRDKNKKSEHSRITR